MRKIYTIFILTLLIVSCKENPDQETKEKYLGSPKSSTLALRLIPNKFFEKNFNPRTLPKQPKQDQLTILNSVLETSPTLYELGKNIFVFSPDFTVNWLINGGYTDTCKYVSIYFKIGSPKKLNEYLNDHKIESTTTHGISTSWVDEKTNEHNLIVRHDNHLLILKVYGSKNAAQELINNASYNSKEEFLEQFETTFKGLRNDIDIRLNTKEHLSSFTPNQLIKDVLNSFDGIVSLNLLNDNIDLKITPLNSSLIIDSIMRPTNLKEGGLASFGVKLDLKAFQNTLEKYGYLDDIDYELKKVNLNYETLQTLTNGSVNLHYLGPKTSNTESISYVFDDNFNEIEKVSYHTTTWQDVNGSVGLINPSLSKDWLLKQHLITQTKKDTYEPILGSKSKIIFDKQELKIGTPTGFETRNTKFLININYNQLAQLDFIKNKNLTFLKLLETARIELDVENQLVVNTKFKGAPFEYLQIVEKIMNPEVRQD